MPNTREQELLALLHAEQQRNGTATPTAAPLPELDPAMLLSASAQREFEAARWPTRAVTSAPAAAEISLQDSSWEISAHDLERISAEAVDDLEALFMDRALRETGASRDRLQLAAVDDFSFDASDGAFERGSPNEAVRFQVGREDPPAMQFSARNMPTDGEVVARIGARGFERVQRPPAAVLRALEVRTMSREPTRAPAPIREAATPESPGKTRLEHLLGPSILDD